MRSRWSSSHASRTGVGPPAPPVMALWNPGGRSARCSVTMASVSRSTPLPPTSSGIPIPQNPASTDRSRTVSTILRYSGTW